MGKGRYDEIGQYPDPNSLRNMTIGIIAAQVVGLLMVILVGSWMGNWRGGFGWDISTVFNYHPLFMTIGMIFLYGDAMLVYRLLRNTTKLHVKILHGLIQVAVFVFACVALKAVFDSHNKAVPKPIPNMYSMHSWVGLSAVILFGIQWVCGFVSFLFPKLSDGLRRMYLPHHKFWGLIIFGLVVAAALMGLTEKAIFLPNGAYAEKQGETYLINFFGSTIVIYAILVVYLVTKFEYARPPDPIH